MPQLLANTFRYLPGKCYSRTVAPLAMEGCSESNELELNVHNRTKRLADDPTKHGRSGAEAWEGVFSISEYLNTSEVRLTGLSFVTFPCMHHRSCIWLAKVGTNGFPCNANGNARWCVGLSRLMTNVDVGNYMGTLRDLFWESATDGVP
ncbi:unnamed protein product [Haemonchus placei]|uniref:Uncharacterized protein n=1 Tax=Haemonchus placei TaxID=6290 RepID=A0A0N4X9X8_HAEPC|nr:unnamed protein product [Haemonchus placei]